MRANGCLKRNNVSAYIRHTEPGRYIPGRKEIDMEKKKIIDGHRKWTKKSALAWVGAVKDGKAKRGLKYCGAIDYLRHHGKKVGA